MEKNLNKKEKGAEALVSQKALFNLLGDITEAMDGLAKTKEYVDNIIKSMIDTLIVIDPDTIIKTVNKATCELLGYKEEELIGKPVAIIFAEVTPFKGARMKKLIEENSIKDHGVAYKTKSGEEIPVSFSGSVMRDKHGDLVGIVGIARDMREIKRLMQKEKELAAQAAAAEADRIKARELEIAYKKLQETQDMLIQAEKLSAAGQLAGGVAHEVKNPLSIIIQGVSYLEKKLPPKERDSIEILGMIREGVDRADRIIGSLLDFSKETKLDLRPEDVNSILENSLTLVKAKFELKNIDVKRDIKKDIPKVLADKRRIEQVFVNILLNAIQAMSEEGKIIIRSYVKELKEATNGLGRRGEDHFQIGEKTVIVEIEDTGAGISKENLKKIFDPFFTTKDSSGGTGLGLSVSLNIIKMHKALIDIKSQIGKGTKAIITLKVA